ncbi:MAG: DUF2786 domain-containing protein [Bifidobacteriaceae bacterium]|jgi:hypothetical protein|nr:DUF2786 domain-containing protein [Bifidobacteriaceae bacterium]
MDQTARAAVIERIKLLMALSSSPHEAEATLAAERATKLMLQWVIDEADLAGQDKKEEPVRVEVALPGDKAGLFDMFRLLQAVAEAHGCLAFFHRESATQRGSRAIGQVATLAGFATETAAVCQLFATLAVVMARDMRQGWRTAHAEAEERVRADLAARGLDSRVRLSSHGKAAYRRGFYRGFASRIAARLEATRAAVEEAQAGTGKALVLAERKDKVANWTRDNLAIHEERIRAARMSQVGWDAGAASGDRTALGLTSIGQEG